MVDTKVTNAKGAYIHCHTLEFNDGWNFQDEDERACGSSLYDELRYTPNWPSGSVCRRARLIFLSSVVK